MEAAKGRRILVLMQELCQLRCRAESKVRTAGLRHRITSGR